MAGLRTVYFIAIAALALIAPALCWHLERRPAESLLEGRQRPELSELTWSAVRAEEAQSAFDVALAFGVPHRDEAMLAHARRQRRLIGFAARLFGFDAWPTYYGSRHCRIASAGAVAEIPDKASPAQKREFAADARMYSELIAAHPEIRCFFALVDAPAFSLAAPLHDLVSDPVDYAYARKHFLRRLPKSCAVIDLGYDKGDDFYRDYFRTDHHWRIQGAVRAYRKIAAALGITPITFVPPAPATAAEFFGSQARQGLDADVEGDAIYDVAYKRSPLHIELNGKMVVDGFLNFGFTGLTYKKQHKFEDMYTGYFPAGEKELYLFNERVASRTLLILGSSYVQCLEHFFAESYREVYQLIAPPNILDVFLTSHKVDDILFLFSPNKIP